jgi:hypothetical protein
MVFIDAHLDFAWNALNWNRDLNRTVPEIRHDKKSMKQERRGRDTVSFPEMQKGEIAVCLATVLARASGLDEPLLDFCSRSGPWRSGDRPQAKGIGEQVRQALRTIEPAGQRARLRQSDSACHWIRQGGAVACFLPTP